MPVAANIDDVIAFSTVDIAEVSYGGVDSLFVQMGLWNDGMFLEAGIFPPSADLQLNPGQRVATDWYGSSLMASSEIEGPGVGASGVVGTAACINAVVRTAYAVKYGVINGYVTTAQQTAVVALYNAVWA